MAILVAGFGAKSSTLTDLKSDIANGRVTKVRVTEGLQPGSSGYATVALVWWDHGAKRYAQVVELSDLEALPPSQLSDYEHVIGHVADSLPQLGGNTLEVVRVSDLGMDTTLLGWHVPDWVGWLAALVWLAGFFLLANGPQPWWATRWGWFWLLFNPLATVTLPAFLLLCGPPPGVENYGGPGKRMGGIWAFVLAAGAGALFAQA